MGRAHQDRRSVIPSGAAAGETEKHLMGTRSGTELIAVLIVPLLGRSTNASPQDATGLED